MKVVNNEIQTWIVIDSSNIISWNVTRELWRHVQTNLIEIYIQVSERVKEQTNLLR